MKTVLVADTPAAWRSWLAENGGSEREIWLVMRKKGSGIPGMTIAEAVEHALCFGWIDGLHQRHERGCTRLRFTPRAARSTWSAVNRARAAVMIERGLMTPAGQAEIDRAKASGRWEVVKDGEEPAELTAELDRNLAARANFDGFPPSSKRLILEWVGGAKRPETRVRRAARMVELAARGIRAGDPAARA